MNLFLSSMYFGNSAHKLTKMLTINKNVAIILNANDHLGDNRTKYYNESKLILNNLGLNCTELDLRNYFKKDPVSLKLKLLNFGLIWVTGGNTFILRRAFYESGLDQILSDLLKNKEIIYGGFSAGACVVTPSLKGLEFADNPNVIPKGYPNEIIWDGLNLTSFCIVPHYKSEQSEALGINKIINFYNEKNIFHHTLNDKSAILIEDDKEFFYDN